MRHLVGPELLETFAESLHYLKVLFFVVTTDVVGFAGSAFSHYFAGAAGVVFYIEPITDLVAFAVDGLLGASGVYSVKKSVIPHRSP
jgi:hypothetical protein